MPPQKLVCPECGCSFQADPNADTAYCPNRRCKEEIDLNEYRRSRDSDDFPKARGN